MSSKKVKDTMLGDKSGINVALEDGKYVVSYTDKVLGNNAFARYALKEDFKNKDDLNWDSERKAFVVDQSFRDVLASSVEKVRGIHSDIEYEKNMMKEEYTQLFSNEEKIKEVRIVDAFTKEGERHNGQILDIKGFNVYQLSGFDKETGIQYVKSHGVDKFLTSQQDWNDIDKALENKFGKCDKPMSIGYGEKNKAVDVAPYVPNAERSKNQLQQRNAINKNDKSFSHSM